MRITHPLFKCIDNNVIILYSTETNIHFLSLELYKAS